jgi:hypothetical protein
MGIPNRLELGGSVRIAIERDPCHKTCLGGGGPLKIIMYVQCLQKYSRKKRVGNSWRLWRVAHHCPAHGGSLTTTFNQIARMRQQVLRASHHSSRHRYQCRHSNVDRRLIKIGIEEEPREEGRRNWREGKQTGEIFRNTTGPGLYSAHHTVPPVDVAAWTGLPKPRAENQFQLQYGLLALNQCSSPRPNLNVDLPIQSPKTLHDHT